MINDLFFGESFRVHVYLLFEVNRPKPLTLQWLSFRGEGHPFNADKEYYPVRKTLCHNGIIYGNLTTAIIVL